MPRFRDLVVCILWMAGVCCVAVGCLDRKGARMDEPVYYKGTAAYDQKLSTFTISEDRAYSIASDFVLCQSGHRSSLWLIEQSLIVGDSYVFSKPHKLGYRLSGIYVNGKTGDVSMRETEGLAPPRAEGEK